MGGRSEVSSCCLLLWLASLWPLLVASSLSLWHFNCFWASWKVRRLCYPATPSPATWAGVTRHFLDTSLCGVKTHFVLHDLSDNRLASGNGNQEKCNLQVSSPIDPYMHLSIRQWVNQSFVRSVKHRLARLLNVAFCLLFLFYHIHISWCWWWWWSSWG